MSGLTPSSVSVGADVAVAAGNAGEPVSGQRIGQRRDEGAAVGAPDQVLQLAQHEAIAADADDARRRAGHRDGARHAIEPAGIAGVDEAFGVGLEVRRGRAVRRRAGRDGAAPSVRAAPACRSRCGRSRRPARRGPSPRGAVTAKARQRDRQAVGVAARADQRGLAEHQHVGQPGSWMLPGRAGHEPLRRAPDREHVLEFAVRQQTRPRRVAAPARPARRPCRSDRRGIARRTRRHRSRDAATACRR